MFYGLMFLGGFVVGGVVCCLILIEYVGRAQERDAREERERQIRQSREEADAKEAREREEDAYWNRLHEFVQPANPYKKLSEKMEVGSTHCHREGGY
jgi:hypothetical protein